MPSASDCDNYFEGERVNASGAERAAKARYNKGARQLRASSASDQPKDIGKSCKSLTFITVGCLARSLLCRSADRACA